MSSRHSMDLTQGPVIKQLWVFAVPILLSNLLQQFYNAADTIVIGQFAEKTDLAAVGSTGSVTGLLLNLFLSLATGVNILCANLYGARKQDALDRCMHNAVVVALLSGVFISTVGMIFAKPILVLMNSPENVIGKATLYMRICFAGTPFSLMYNFCAGILRAHGDTKRPMLILMVSGLTNVLLNLLFVAVFRWGVAGVAVATVVSQLMTAVSVLVILFDPKGEFKLKFGKLRIYGNELRKTAAIGLPCGFSGILTSAFNVVFQSVINTFGDTFMAATTAFNSITGFGFLIFGAFGTASVSFAGQNYGAKQYNRIDAVLRSSCIMAAAVFASFCAVATLFDEQLLGLYSEDAEVIRTAVPLLWLQSWGAIFCCLSSPTQGCLQGIGRTTGSTMINLVTIITSRLLWVFFVFPANPVPVMLYACYPVSYAINAAFQLVYYLRCRKQLNTANRITA